MQIYESYSTITTLKQNKLKINIKDNKSFSLPDEKNDETHHFRIPAIGKENVHTIMQKPC